MNELVVRRRWSEGQSRDAHGRRPTVVQRLAGALLVMRSGLAYLCHPCPHLNQWDSQRPSWMASGFGH